MPTWIPEKQHDICLDNCVHLYYYYFRPSTCLVGHKAGSHRMGIPLPTVTSQMFSERSKHLCRTQVFTDSQHSRRIGNAGEEKCLPKVHRRLDRRTRSLTHFHSCLTEIPSAENNVNSLRARISGADPFPPVTTTGTRYADARCPTNKSNSEHVKLTWLCKKKEKKTRKQTHDEAAFVSLFLFFYYPRSGMTSLFRAPWQFIFTLRGKSKRANVTCAVAIDLFC